MIKYSQDSRINTEINFKYTFFIIIHIIEIQDRGHSLKWERTPKTKNPVPKRKIIYG